MRDGKPPPCEWRAETLHSLTYARLYVSGWWCDRHAPHTWRIRHQPPTQSPTTEVAAPTSAAHGQEPR